MDRSLFVIAAAALIFTACSSDEAPGAGSTEPDVTTAATSPATAPATAAATAPATAPPIAPAATDPPATDPPPAVGFSSDLAITEVEFDDHVTITNLGSGEVNLDGLWLCNRPNYLPLPSTILGAGDSIDISDLFVPADGGEVGLYSSNSFADSSAMLDYVAWGAGGGRLGVAVVAGLWPADDSVPASGTSITAPDGGASAADWTS